MEQRVERELRAGSQIQLGAIRAFEQTDEHPVVNVSWNDAVAFCEWLSQKEGELYRLPTEAEWEYACRAGTTTQFYGGDNPELLSELGNVIDGTFNAKFPGWTLNSANDGYVYTAPVGQFVPNQFGLYDMHGNVWERCSDWCGNYSAAPLVDPEGPPNKMPVSRGGSWANAPVAARSAYRTWNDRSHRSIFIGFSRGTRFVSPGEEIERGSRCATVSVSQAART